MEIRVLSDALHAAGDDVSRLGGEVSAVAGQVRSAAAGALGGCGFPEPSAALEDLAARWSSALARSGDSVSSLGVAFNAAATLYAVTDELSIPGLGST